MPDVGRGDHVREQRLLGGVFGSTNDALHEGKRHHRTYSDHVEDGQQKEHADRDRGGPPRGHQHRAPLEAVGNQAAER
ncbi:MAG: hypothetical protein U5Q44_03635 [Dehalococcoidia bacterium]|nr:hypothetical protein [Dehalococcoidia bacterium]